MTKNTSRSTMGGSEKSRFFDYFFRTIGDFISKNSVFLRILQVLKKNGPSSNRNFFIFLGKKNCPHSQHVMSKIHEFWEYDFKIFSHFLKKVEKNDVFWLLSHIEKVKKNTKKMMFFWKFTNITFELTMGGSWKKNSKQIYQFHHCKYKNNRPLNCKYLLFFNDFTMDNDMVTDCSIFCVFYHLNL